MKVALLIAAAALGMRLHADVILSAAALNDALRKMQRLQQTIGTAAGTERADAWFQLGVEADALTTLLNDEVAAHGSQEKGLIDLALSRTRELGVSITYSAGKKKFFYDNAAFREYLTLAPRGTRVADATFKLIEGDFFQMTAGDVDAIVVATERKRVFLRKYGSHPSAIEVHLMLSVDYRDLFRHYQGEDDRGRRDRYRELTRQQLRVLMKSYPKTEQAE